MSKWQAEKAERNRQSLARLNRALPRHLSIGGYVLGTRPPFRAADAAARGRFVLACPSDPRRSAGACACCSERSAQQAGLGSSAITGKHGLPATYRAPPAPYRERAYMQGPGFCCVCGQPVYRFGWHVDLWDGSANMKANWHCACVIAWQFWNAPSGYARLLRRLQALALRPERRTAVEERRS